jgi:hypothetical protein
MDNFRLEEVNKALANDGFAIVPFASKNEIAELSDYYRGLPEESLSGMQVTMFNPSYDYRKGVDEKIKEICSAKAMAMMKGYRVLYTNFMIKQPGKEGNFPVHQDWTYVDERFYLSYAFWIPLQSVNEENGALHVIKKSHRFNTGLRGPFVHEPFQHLAEIIKDNYSQPVVLNAGEALIWDHRLIHFSGPNFSRVPRIAITLIMVPDKADVFHCIAKQNEGFDLVEKFQVDTEFYLTYQIGKKTDELKLVETIKQERKDFTENYIENVLQ